MKVSLPFRYFMAETYGTFVVVFLGTFAYITLLPYGVVDAAVVSALAYGFGYVAMHYTLSHISGAHFNPILTVAAYDDGRLSSRMSFLYIAAQVLGALAATSMIAALVNGISGLTFQVLAFEEFSPFGVNLYAALIIELFLGFFLVYVYLAVSKRRLAAWTGISVGAMMSLLMLSTGLLTGGHANPARSIASLWLMGPAGRMQLPVYLVAPLVGALLAGWFYRHLKYPDQHDVA
jgi:aquaporin Z